MIILQIRHHYRTIHSKHGVFFVVLSNLTLKDSLLCSIIIPDTKSTVSYLQYCCTRHSKHSVIFAAVLSDQTLKNSVFFAIHHTKHPRRASYLQYIVPDAQEECLLCSIFVSDTQNTVFLALFQCQLFAVLHSCTTS